MLLGLALARRALPAEDPAPYWASAVEANAVVGCACRTPPHALVLTRMPERAIASLADDVGRVDTALGGVNGPASAAEAFAVAWVARRGGAWHTRFRMRLYALGRVEAAGPRPAGALREIAPPELPLAQRWMDEFVRDVGVSPSPSDLAARIANGQLFFWIDDETPRAMVSWSRETRHGCAINTVYTPPQFRSRGYATAAVATLSEMLLRAGRRFCCLYADLENPTANAIYAKIGFRKIRDDAEIAFDPGTRP